MKDIILLGAGGHCKSVIDVIEQENKYKIKGVIDNNPDLKNTTILDYGIIGTDLDLKKISKTIKFALITVGQIKSPLERIKLYNLAVDLGFELPTITSPLAYVSKYAGVGIGTIVMHHSIVNANSYVGKNCIINSKALIEHDCVIKDHCHISTSANINGNVHVEQGVFIGSNSTIKESIKIKKNSFIKAGSLIKYI